MLLPHRNYPWNGTKMNHVGWISFSLREKYSVGFQSGNQTFFLSFNHWFMQQPSLTVSEKNTSHGLVLEEYKSTLIPKMKRQILDYSLTFNCSCFYTKQKSFNKGDFCSVYFVKKRQKVPRKLGQSRREKKLRWSLSEARFLEQICVTLWRLSRMARTWFLSIVDASWWYYPSKLHWVLLVEPVWTNELKYSHFAIGFFSKTWFFKWTLSFIWLFFEDIWQILLKTSRKMMMMMLPFFPLSLMFYSQAIAAESWRSIEDYTWNYRLLLGREMSRGFHSKS